MTAGMTAFLGLFGTQPGVLPAAMAHPASPTPPSIAQAPDIAQAPESDSTQAITAALPDSSPSNGVSVASGTYLFGEAAEAGQVGREYMIMQVIGDQVTGGFYQPQSEFSCFYGSINAKELSLWVEDPHRPGGISYTVPIYLNNQFAVSEFVLPYESALGLQGTYRVDEIDAEGRRVLDYCRTSQDLTQRFEANHSFVSPGSIMPTELLTR